MRIILALISGSLFIRAVNMPDKALAAYWLLVAVYWLTNYFCGRTKRDPRNDEDADCWNCRHIRKDISEMPCAKCRKICGEPCAKDYWEENE